MNKYNRHIFALMAGIICFVIYVITLYPSVTFIDSGELAAVCYTFGIPHPTGYPLFLILGYAVSHLPLPGTVIYRLNILSAVESSAAVIITFYTVLYLLENLNLSGKEKSAQLKKNINYYILAFISAVISGLIKSVWFNAEQVEVYSLHTLFISAIFFVLLKLYFNLKSPHKRYWAYLFLLIGISAANHSTTLYIIPSVILLFYYQYKENRAIAKSVIVYALFILPGLFLYFVLVIAAASKPYLNWSDPENIGNLIYHIRGSDFSQLMFSSSGTFINNAGDFFTGLFPETAILPGITGLLGFAYMWKHEKRLFIIEMTMVLICLLNSFNYSTVEIQSFYLIVYFLIAVNVSTGIIMLFDVFQKNSKLTSKKVSSFVMVASVLMFVISVGYNFKENDNSSDYSNEDITVNMLNVLEPNSILLTYDYAFVYSASYYYQQVEKLRPDVKVFNVRFLSAPWYLHTIQKYYPDVYVCFKEDAENYISNYNADSPGHPARLTNLVKAFIDKTNGKFPLYVTVDFLLSREMNMFIKGYSFVPEGVAYKISSKNIPYDSSAGLASLNLKFRKYEPAGFHKNKLYFSTPGVYYETAYYHYNNGNFEIAIKFLEKSLELNSKFPDAINLMNQINKQVKNK